MRAASLMTSSTAFFSPSGRQSGTRPLSEGSSFLRFARPLDIASRPPLRCRGIPSCRLGRSQGCDTATASTRPSSCQAFRCASVSASFAISEAAAKHRAHCLCWISRRALLSDLGASRGAATLGHSLNVTAAGFLYRDAVCVALPRQAEGCSSSVVQPAADPKQVMPRATRAVR